MAGRWASPLSTWRASSGHPDHPSHLINHCCFFILPSPQFKDHLKKAEAVSEFAKTKTIAEQRRFLPVYQVREELLQVRWSQMAFCYR